MTIDNLDLLSEKMKNLDQDEGRMFLNSFVGASSAYLTDEEWKSCLETASFVVELTKTSKTESSVS